MIKLWAVIESFLTPYLKYIEYGVFVLWSVTLVWSTHRIDGMADKAATADHRQTIINAIPKIITETNTIIKVIHDAKDKCAFTDLPNAVANELRKQ